MTKTRLHDKTYSTIKLCKSSLELNEVNRFLLKIPLVKSFLFEQIYQIFFSRMDSYLPVGSICEARSVTILRSASIDPSVKASDWNITPRRIQKFNLQISVKTLLVFWILMNAMRVLPAACCFLVNSKPMRSSKTQTSLEHVSSQHLLAQIQQWKCQNNKWNLFKDSYKDNRKKWTSFCYVYCKL